MKRVAITLFIGLVVGISLSQPVQAVSWGNCSVQSGDTTIGAGLTTSTVTPASSIPDVNQAFILATATGDVNVRVTQHHLVTAELNSSGQAVFTRVGTNSTVYVHYQIIQCTDSDKISVQRGNISVAAGASSGTAALGTAVDTSRSIVLVSTRSNDASAGDSSSVVTAALQNSTTVAVQRAGIGFVTVTAHYQVVEFDSSSGVSVQTAETTLATGQASTTSTLTTTVDPDRSWVYCSYDATNNGLQQTAIGCELTNASTVTLYRAAASAYTNRIRYYVVTWPGDTVTVSRGSDSFDSSSADNTEVDHDIAITNADNDYSFGFVTNTTTGTSTPYPRQLWLASIVDTTTLRMTFWRSDAAGSTDTAKFYWQVVNFPLPYEASGWGWIGNTEAPSFGSALISFSCENLTTYTSQLCGDGTAGTRYNYGVSLKRGGCGSNCDVTGQAWVGWYDSADTGGTATQGMIDFDPVISASATVPANIVGDDASTAEDETSDAHWNEETGELYGWARFRALRDEETSLGGTADDWGWVNLRGTVATGEEYGVDFDTDTLALSGWAWNDDGTQPGAATAEDGSGFGWMKFDLENSGTVTDAWLRTTQADVYSQSGFNSSISASAYGEYNATYLILHNGSVTNFDSSLGSSGVITEDLGGVPIDNTNDVYRGVLGSLYVNELILQAADDGHSQVGNCDDTLLSGFTNPLSNTVFYCSGDLTLNNNVTLYNATGNNIGSGTVVVGGNLYVNDNINYFNDAIDQNVNNLASVGFIVLGRVILGSSVTHMVGAYVVLGDADPATSGNYDFDTGAGASPLRLDGLVMARSFNLQRTNLGTSTDPEPAEDFRYDGRVFANPPPGLEDFASLLPVYN